MIVIKSLKKNALWSFLSSVKLGVGLVIAIISILIVSSFLEPDKAYQYIYHSLWFIIILASFCINILLCTINRLEVINLRKLGILITHLGVLNIAFGVIIGSVFGEKGFIALQKGEMTNTYQRAEDKKEVVLPFRIKLEDFNVEFYPPYLYILFRGENIEKNFIPRENDEIRVKNFKVRIKHIFRNFRVVVAKKSNELLNPAIRLQLNGKWENNHQVSDEAMYWLLADRVNGSNKEENNDTVNSFSNRLELSTASLCITYKFYPDYTLFEKEMSDKYQQPSSDRGRFEEKLVVALVGRKIQSFPVEIGKKYMISNKHWITIKEAVLDYTARESPLPNNPALCVEIHGPQGKEKRWVFANFPDFDSVHKIIYKDIKLRYNFPQNVSCTHKVIIAEFPQHKRTLIQKRLDKVVLQRDFNIGDNISLSNIALDISIKEFIPDALVKYVDDTSNQQSSQHYAIELEVYDAGKLTETIILSSEEKEAKITKDKEILFAYYEKEKRDIKNFRSTISILDFNSVTGGKSLTETVSVNSPVTYKGYRIYQASWDPGRMDWTGFLIVKDPGIPVVYIGFILSGIGILYLSLARVIFKKKSVL